MSIRARLQLSRSRRAHVSVGSTPWGRRLTVRREPRDRRRCDRADHDEPAGTSRALFADLDQLFDERPLTVELTERH